MTEQKKTRRQLLEDFISKKPDDAFSRYALAIECMKAEDSEAADTHFRALLGLNADYVPAYLMYAQFLVRQQRPDQAREVLTAGITAAITKGDSHARSELEALLGEIS
jgi:predicted Zn-dependent protease